MRFILIQFFMLLYATSFTQDVSITGQFLPSGISVLDSSELQITAELTGINSVIAPGAIQVIIVYPSDGTYEAPNVAPSGPDALLFNWSRTVTNWSGTLNEEILENRTFQFFQKTVGLQVSSPDSVDTNLEIRLLSSTDTNPSNNTNVAPLLVRDSLSLECNRIDTIYLNENGTGNIIVDSLLTATTDSLCLPLDTTVVGADNLICNNLDNLVEFRILVQDQCNNQDSCTFNVLVLDTIAPILSCIGNTVLYLDDYCQSTLLIPSLNFTDNCRIDTIYNDYSDESNVEFDFLRGDYTISFYAEDESTNIDSCAFNITVLDTISPALTCSNKDFGLSNDGSNTFTAEDLIDSYGDNCPIDSIVGRRMSGGCTPDDLLFGETITFCCDDHADTVMVELKVIDESGLETACMIEITINDNLPPTGIDISDITVSCDFFIDINDLSPFGKIATTDSLREDIVINDLAYAPSFIAGKDGLVSDNCGFGPMSIIETVQDNRINNIGTIVRNFEIYDINGNGPIFLHQSITVFDADPLTREDIRFPRDTFFLIGSNNDCSSTADPQVTGEPIIDNDDICTMPSFTMEDELFEISGQGCSFIRRTWTVIDMAQFKPNTNNGRWTSTQFIELRNRVAPTLDSALCVSRTVCLPFGSCASDLTFNIAAIDDCTAADKLYFKHIVDNNTDGTIDLEKDGNTFTSFFEPGVHNITWKVEDKCGNLSKCTFDVTVTECKPPVPVCHYGLSIDLNVSGSSEIWATDFNAGSYDDCSPTNDLIYSFDENTFSPNLVIDSNDIGRKDINLYVKDQADNQSFCSTYLIVTNNSTNTDSTNVNQINISGRVLSHEDQTIQDVTITLNDGAETFIQQTNDEGEFIFSNLNADENYILHASKVDDCMNGVSTLDLVMIQRHILGIDKFANKEAYIAADINNSASITASDLVQLRKLILGQIDELPQDCWAICTDQSLEEDAVMHYYDRNIYVENDYPHVDFTAVKIGDVNKSATINFNKSAEPRSFNNVDIEISERVIGTQYHYDFNLISGVHLEGYQFEIFSKYFSNESLDLMVYLDQKNYQLSNTSIKVSSNEATKQGTKLIASFISPYKLDIAQELYLGTDNGLFAEAYNSKLEVLEIKLSSRSSIMTPLAIYPNPFVSNTTLEFNASYDGEAELTIYTINGLSSYQSTYGVDNGQNRLTLNESFFNHGSGLYIVELRLEDRVETKKLYKVD